VQEAFAARQSVVLSQIGSLLDFHAALLGEFFDVKAILFYTVRMRMRANPRAAGHPPFLTPLPHRADCARTPTRRRP